MKLIESNQDKWIIQGILNEIKESIKTSVKFETILLYYCACSYNFLCLISQNLGNISNIGSKERVCFKY